MFASRTLDDCKQLQLGASTRCALRESRYPMGGRDPEFRCVCTCVRDCTRRVRHRVAACAPGSGDPAPGVFFGGRNCGVLCHCDEPTSEGGIEDVFRITSLTTGENHVRGKVAGMDLEWLGHGVISGSD